ncbi:S-layer homology domain-containing protein [Paenibacillus pini]|uniref:SLH domain-containing protein n=1 Tax=Paenibacillus pini JCM 16418 TaxID=1236976 RepID=W7YJU4_9BACL|nr:S-layer homology domain-containing protein [Paenibacillus pini]GAF08787.1 hypothetical protein JCM16418_2892 [Paenibacillus pini JCM 16418]
MKKYQMYLSAGLLSLSILNMNVASSFASDLSFKDVKAGYWGYQNIKWAIDNKIVDGYPDGNFKPNQRVNQSEFVAMLIRAFKPSDLPTQLASDRWDAPYLKHARALGWKTSTQSTSFTRGKAALLLTNASGKNYNMNDSIQYLLDLGLAEGKTVKTVKGFQQNDTLTRTEAVTFIERLRQRMDTLQISPSTEQKYNRADHLIVYKNTSYDFSLTLPKSWEGKYTVTDTAPTQAGHNINFINKATKQGVLFTISVWSADYWNKNKDQISGQIQATKLGAKGNNVYIFHTPTDVQYDPSDKVSTKDYQVMSKDVSMIKSSFTILK